MLIGASLDETFEDFPTGSKHFRTPGETAQRVVQVSNDLTLAVGFLGEVVVGVVLVVLAERGREIGLRDAPISVISEGRLVAARIGDAGMSFSHNKSKSKAPPITRRDRWAIRQQRHLISSCRSIGFLNDDEPVGLNLTQVHLPRR